MNNNSYITTVLDQILVQYLDGMGQFFFVAKIISFIGLLVSAYFAYFDIMATGNNEAINKFLRKFILIFLGIFYYNVFIKVVNVPLDAITNVVREVASADLVDSNSSLLVITPTISNNNEELDKRLNAYYEGSEANSENEDSLFTDVMAASTNAVMNVLTGYIIDALSIIAEIALMVLNVIRGFYLIILTIFGIFVISLSSFPSLEGSFSQWLMKYINVYLWLAIGFVLQGVLFRLQKFLVDSPSNEFHGGTNIFSLLVAVCTIVGFIAIPSISSWLINAATTGASGKMANAASSQITKQIVTKAATGGAI